MKKSPLSRPNNWKERRSNGWKSFESPNQAGYGYVKSAVYGCYSHGGNYSNNSGSDDFIPLNNTTPPSEQKRHSNNWHGPGNNRNYRNSNNGAFNHRNNLHTNQKIHFNNMYSPYKHTGKQFNVQNKNYKKGGHRHVNISSYVDVKSSLEDPWAELMQKLNDSRSVNEKELKSDIPLPTRSDVLNTEKLNESVSSSNIPFVENIEHSCNAESSSALSLSELDHSVRKSEPVLNTKLDDACISQKSKTEESMHIVNVDSCHVKEIRDRCCIENSEKGMRNKSI